MQQQNPYIQLLAYFFGGVAGVFAALTWDFFLEGPIETGLGQIGMVAFFGGIVIAFSEWMSWLVANRWMKGVVFGVTAGLGAGILNFWFYDGGFLQSVISWCVGGIVGGVIFKSFSRGF